VDIPAKNRDIIAKCVEDFINYAPQFGFTPGIDNDDVALILDESVRSIKVIPPVKMPTLSNFYYDPDKRQIVISAGFNKITSKFYAEDPVTIVSALAEAFFSPLVSVRGLFRRNILYISALFAGAYRRMANDIVNHTKDYVDPNNLPYNADGSPSAKLRDINHFEDLCMVMSDGVREIVGDTVYWHEMIVAGETKYPKSITDFWESMQEYAEACAGHAKLYMAAPLCVGRLIKATAELRNDRRYNYEGLLTDIFKFSLKNQDVDRAGETQQDRRIRFEITSGYAFELLRQERGEKWVEEREAMKQQVQASQGEKKDKSDIYGKFPTHRRKNVQKKKRK